MESKVCPKCKTEKSVEHDFYNNKTTKDGLTSWCKQCMKKNDRVHPEYALRALVKKYGLTEGEYRAMLGKPCPICLNDDRKMVVDHDHSTGKVRGMICCRCNRALGLLGDTAESVLRAATYLTSTNDS